METLATALSQLAIDHPKEYKAVKRHVINPKALTLAQLYGSYDAASHEWTDGALPIILNDLLLNDFYFDGQYKLYVLA